MPARNSRHGYGWAAQLLHWSMALAVIALFALGLWMTSLTYYDPWYALAPRIHIGAGVFLAAALVFRLFWRAVNPQPDMSGLKPWERAGAALAHWSMYALTAAVAASGWIIAAADGRPVDVLGLFEIPAAPAVKGLEQAAGEAHYALSFALIGTASVHTLAALKHHFINKDRTLTRMLPRAFGGPENHGGEGEIS